MELWVVSALGLLIMLLWTLISMILCAHVFISLWLDLILRVSWLISPFLGPCSDCPFCLYSFFSSWVVLHYFRPGAVSPPSWSFPDYPALWAFHISACYLGSEEQFSPWFYTIDISSMRWDSWLSIHWCNREYLLMCIALVLHKWTVTKDYKNEAFFVVAVQKNVWIISVNC